MPEPKTAREVAVFLLNDLIHYQGDVRDRLSSYGHDFYERDVRHLTAGLEAWAEQRSGPFPAVAKCEWCDWELSYSAETIIEEATILRQAVIDHCEAAHPERFKKSEQNK